MQRRAFLGLSLCGAINAVANTQQQDNALWIKDDQTAVFLSVVQKIELVKRAVGHGNFNILSFDAMLQTAKRYRKIGAFDARELAFMEERFYEDPQKYGFFGAKTVANLTDVINIKETIKLDASGQYLFGGISYRSYERVITDVGNSLELTSGIRSVAKQMNLYFNKIKSTGGNITQAVHSIAPPAYSYHSIGDFDVGKKGWGHKNFTVSFAATKEFWRLRQLSYIQMRYTINNEDGVRFEPWHVKII
ncbi:MAG: D-alanyl-D-alanine carboxypeptidase family protein [Sulfurospirillum sp.]|nr:D-alanyl-D-alanine carboxypeptidase family protein [Sulfurospirillum sp.]